MPAEVNIMKPHLYLGQYDLTSQQPRLDGSVAYDEIDSKGGNSISHTSVPGLAAYRVEHEVFLTEGAAGTEAILDAATGVDVVASWHPLTFADGGPAWFYKGSVFTKDQSGNIGDPFKLVFSGLSKEAPGFIRGKILAAKASRMATGQGTARQLGAVAAGKSLYAALHCFAASGSAPTLDVVVESDDGAGFASPITRATFPQLTAAGSEYISAATAVTDDWWRVKWTIGGGSPDFNFAVVVGIK